MPVAKSWLVAAPDLAVEEVGGELVLMCLDTIDVVVLNATASDIWLLAPECANETDLAQRLAAAYDVSEAMISTEVGAAVDLLTSRGFLLRSILPIDG